MSYRMIFGILIALASVLTLIFIILQNLDLAVVFMAALFALTNGMRARSFKEKGFPRESKWMKGMSIFFTIAAVFMLVLYIV